MTTLAEKPLSEDELRRLIRDDKVFAFGFVNDDTYIIRNAERRREFEIRAMALEHYLHTTKWVKP